MKLDRLGDITSELSSSLLKSIVLPNGFLEWLSRPLPDRLRERLKQGQAGQSSRNMEETSRAIVPRGPMFLMGGSPVPDEAVVAMIHLAGGRSASLAVIPVASRDPQSEAEHCVRLFTRFGMRKTESLAITTREQAESPEWALKLKRFDAVFLCGEDASLGLSVLKNTGCAAELQAMQDAGKLVAGLCGGAAILGEQVITSNDTGETLTQGLGLAPGLLVETGFSQKQRFSSLMWGLNRLEGSHLMGVGLDQGAALAIREGEAKVLGESSVTFVDPRESAGRTIPGVNGAKVHVLLEHYGINLRTRKPVMSPKDAAKVAGDR